MPPCLESSKVGARAHPVIQSRQRMPWGILVLIPWLGLLGGCADLTNLLSLGPAIGVDAKTLIPRFQEAQKKRQAAFKHWQAEGTLDIEVHGNGRRNRVKLSGEAADRIRLLIFGPFQQVAVDLLMTPTTLQLTDPARREVVEVPATAAGMAILTGLELQPQRLVKILLAETDPVRQESAAQQDDSLAVTTTTGETLRLDPASASLSGRHGATETGRKFQVLYQWNEAKPPLPAMPARIRIDLDRESHLDLQVETWRFPSKWSTDPFVYPPARTSFRQVRPLAGGAS